MQRPKNETGQSSGTVKPPPKSKPSKPADPLEAAQKALLIQQIEELIQEQKKLIEEQKELRSQIDSNFLEIQSAKKDNEIQPAIKPYRRSKKANILAQEPDLFGGFTIPEYKVMCSMKLKTSQLKEVTSSYDASQYCRSLYEEGTITYKEFFYILFLNRSNKINGFMKVSEGGITGTVADPRIIIQAALMAGASSLILCHNHPSGSLKPSQQDNELTQKVKGAAKYFDIKILDHIIVTDEDYFSFSKEGLL